VSLVLAVLVVAVAGGLLAGGSLARLGDLPLRRRGLVVLAVVAQAAGGLVGGVAYPVGLAVSAVVALAFLALNRGTRGTGLVGLGVVANALVVGLNGAMPVSLPAADRAGVTVTAVVTGADPRHEVLGPGTRLHLLGDVVPVPLPALPQVVSPGDVLVAAGLGQLVLLGMRRPGHEGGPRPVRPRPYSRLVRPLLRPRRRAAPRRAARAPRRRAPAPGPRDGRPS
jgi:hypothetical protein